MSCLVSSNHTNTNTNTNITNNNNNNCSNNTNLYILSRCSNNGCNKKLGLMPYKCKCNLEYCITHRAPEAHTCSFDYKTIGRKNIEKLNPQIVNEKIIKL